MASEGESRSTRKFDFYSGFAALLAFIACNGLILAAVGTGMSIAEKHPRLNPVNALLN